jgi:tetraacyldisaccharide 4'-kinase
MFERIWKALLARERYSPLAIAAILLYPLSLVYRLLVWSKRTLLSRPIEVGVPVISVGNITVGGSGKTPLVEAIARNLHDDGFRVGVVSSGYGRQEAVSFVEPGDVVRRRTVAQTGDEVMLLAQSLPGVLFSVDRVKAMAAVRLADTGQVDVIVVDDGFQHFRLQRSVDIVVFDASVPSRQLKMFPYGVLREPKSALRRADIIVITREDDAERRRTVGQNLARIQPEAPQFSARFQIAELAGRTQRCPVTQLKGKSVFVFAGIGNFSYLQHQIEQVTGGTAHALELPDHEKYQRATLEKIKRLADQHAPDYIVTTAKDWVKVSGFDFGREICYVPLTMELEPDVEQLVARIRDCAGLGKRKS